MGLDYTTYLGPYFECKVGKKQITNRYRSCPNPSCPQHKSKGNHTTINFCYRCGSAITLVKDEITKDAVVPREVEEKVNNRLGFPSGDGIARLMDQEGIHIWLGNQLNDGIGLRFDPTERGVFKPIADVDEITESIDKLKAFYSKEYKILKEIYGADNVRVGWGLLSFIW